MEGKVSIGITNIDGEFNTLEGDTAIIFAFDNASDLEDGDLKTRIRIMGKPILAPFVHHLISDCIAEVIKNINEGHPTLAAFYLHLIAEDLLKKEQEIMSNISDLDVQKDQIFAARRLLQNFKTGGNENYDI